MIVITGAAGFIGSCLITKLNSKGYKNLVLVDDFSHSEKSANFENKSYSLKINRNIFFEWLSENYQEVSFVFHIGARTDTTEFNVEIFNTLNLNYTKRLWTACAAYHIPMVYASSAATYGMGEYGFNDDHSIIEKLKPLNPYGESKNDFDKWAIGQEKAPYFWAGLKFFNVYGPNEFHKGRMASVIFHTHRQVKENGKVKLFKSHHPDYADGMQLRDFVYVKDVVDVMFFLMLHKRNSGIYNLGTGKARAFLHLAEATFSAMGLKPNIEFIDTPIDIRDKYQYFTQANMDKLHSIGYTAPFHSLEDGVTDYVKNHLIDKRYY
ncbi:MAG: ADP-glyceromanno-heptose 6-epimerase [Bacteroidales bacterium]|nr:ADP-glyceromanno-heptose 6-epimerase [Bacteroidales bacterium]